MEEFYGIDLGTTNSCIAIIDEDDSVTVVTNIGRTTDHTFCRGL